MRKIRTPSEDYIQSNRQEIGRQIRILRERKGFSQVNLAEVMDVNRSTISKIETGKFSITIDYLVKFAWHLDFTIGMLEKEGK
jgi:transcriptional regulator with XRE-family HTH domain